MLHDYIPNLKKLADRNRLENVRKHQREREA